MLKLTERLQQIADFIEPGSRVADIGTDHGYIPIYLAENGISGYVVAGDINEGPLEMMKENLEKYLGDDTDGICMRLGGGLDVITVGEVDTVVIAGMGGLLMQDILEADPDKTCSVGKFILQPRNAQDKLRKWLLERGFAITREALVRESRFVWEIIEAMPPERENWSCDETTELEKMPAAADYFRGRRIQFEVGCRLIDNRDALLGEFIEKKLAVQRKIAENAGRSDSENAKSQRELAESQIGILEEILKDVNK